MRRERARVLPQRVRYPFPILTVPEGIGVPRYKIYLTLKHVVIKLRILMHKVCRCRQRRVLSYRLYLTAYKVSRSVCDKSVPVNYECGISVAV